MPAFAEKGVTTEQAKALVAYMKQLKNAADKKEPSP
jgi:mono/diheme cytochrome c family protein